MSINSYAVQHRFSRSILCFTTATVILLVSAMLSGCSTASGLELGTSIPKESPIIALETVLSAPAEYNGKTFVMKGMISSQCASLCEFAMKDGVHKATIFPQGYKFPKLPIGKPVTVLVQATAGEEQVVLSALGLRIE